jgi:hypothetical protein
MEPRVASIDPGRAGRAAPCLFGVDYHGAARAGRISRSGLWCVWVPRGSQKIDRDGHQLLLLFRQNAGFYKIVTPENLKTCPNAPQYSDKLVNDVERLVMFRTYRFPKNDSIASVEVAAKTASRNLYVDTIIFGGWRD